MFQSLSLIALLATSSLLPAGVSGFPVANESPLVLRNNYGGGNGQRYVKDPQPNTTLAPYPTYRALTECVVALAVSCLHCGQLTTPTFFPLSFDYESFNVALYQVGQVFGSMRDWVLTNLQSIH